MDWLDLLAVQGTLKGLLQHHSSKASILLCSAFFTVQLSHPYMTTGKTTALTRWTLVGQVMSLLLNMLSRLVITFLPRSKRLLISWLQSPSAVILLVIINQIKRGHCPLKLWISLKEPVLPWGLIKSIESNLWMSTGIFVDSWVSEDPELRTTYLDHLSIYWDTEKGTCFVTCE